MPVFYQIEEKQRADARERKEKGIEWQQKVSGKAVCVCNYYSVGCIIAVCSTW